MSRAASGLAEAFKALGDPVRLRLFSLLTQKEELCVCHLTDALDLPQSTVSRHLAVLRHAGLVETRRDGKWIHYRLTGDMASSLSKLLQTSADDVLRADAARLNAAMQGCS